jgi:hypothetical protein
MNFPPSSRLGLNKSTIYESVEDPYRGVGILAGGEAATR